MLEGFTLAQLREQFEGVVRTTAAGLSAHPRVVALVAKWDKVDLVPGLSDLDFRVVCDEQTTADDWVALDRLVGRVHLDMVRGHPEWNRINEHTAGAGMTLAELGDDRFHHPEYPVWSLWWGRADWLDELKRRTFARPFGADDERYHLQRFLSYFSPYIHGIDPPINLGPFESKYALHSRCWHYFAPPMLSAAALVARAQFSGKRAALCWLRDHGIAAGAVQAVLDQVDAHYETPERIEPARLQKFEELLFAGFQEALAALRPSLRAGASSVSGELDELKRSVATMPLDSLAELLENVRFARIRAGRFFFYLNAPGHFDASRQLFGELTWVKKLVLDVLKTLRCLTGAAGLAESLARLGTVASPAERVATEHMLTMIERLPKGAELRRAYERAVAVFPDYYRAVERAFAYARQLAARERLDCPD